MLMSNNAPLQVQSLDVSGLSDSFRDGQKLRQEYESRQQTKALNELMGIEDFNERIAKARTHKYAGALVPELQKSEQDRLTAEQTYNQGQADINKTNAEVGKINNEAGEIGAKTTGQTIKNLIDKYGQISAGALTQDKQYFATMLGDFQNAGVINPDQKGQIINMMVTDPEGAVAVMQRIARGTIDNFKATAPTAQVLDGKDAAYLYTTNGFTGEANAPTAKIEYGVSKTDQMKDATSRANNQYTVDAGERNSERSLQGTQYVADTNYAGKVYGVDSAAQTASNAQAVDWYKAKTGAAIAQQNANTAETKARQPVGANGQPVRKLEANERAKLFEIQEQQNADKSVIQTLDKMMKLVDNSYSGVAASGRAKGMSNIGLGGEKADNTVLYDNLATSQALAQLKATFGSAPTEGERKILMDIQASASKTPMQKKQIISQAFRAVQARQKYREKLANGIRSGQYMVPTTTNTKANTSTNSGSSNSKGASIIGGILGGK